MGSYSEKDWALQKSTVKKQYSTFVKHLKPKDHKTLAKKAEDLNEQAFEEIDCLQCANCCKSIPPIVNRTDRQRIAKYLGMKVTEFQEQYLKVDGDDDYVMNSTPCTFLEEDNSCQIYDVRPKACRQYPHTDGNEFTDNINLHVQNIDYCPAVFHIVNQILAIPKRKS